MNSTTNPARMLAASAFVALAGMMMTTAACSSPSNANSAFPGNNPNAEANDNDDLEGICLLNNCNSDAECVGCQDGRDTCLEDENRCVACNPADGTGCEPGETCSPFGICAPSNLTCPTDSTGTPQIACSKNADCLACSPMHQVCDTATGQCQACTDTNTQHCLASDICMDGECAAKCPSSCEVDNDCGQCGGPGNEAHACNEGQCAECSDTYPCAAGLECVSGSCIAGCGIPGSAGRGDCLNDEDCNFCGDSEEGDSGWQCSKPINANGPNDRGTCAPAAAGCSDLGGGIAVLPQPWSDVTNLCSNDTDCSGVGIDFNVGKLIRDIIGSNSVNLGFTTLEINDANVQYDMSRCADIELTNNISCGVCVPCTQDADCQPLNVDNFIGDLFSSQPLAQIAGALLIDLIYGDNPDHDLNFFCQPVAGGYGVCAPCSNPAQACGQGLPSSNGGNPGSGANTCAHNVCQTGVALDPTCDPLVQQICNNDFYCCNVDWDATCVADAQAAGANCGGSNGSGSGSGGGCSHSECTQGLALPDGCSQCATDVCDEDPYCCSGAWDGACVDLAEQTSSCGC